jgi:hypothetical protein
MTGELFNEVFEERAAIREFDGLLTREEAERLGLLDAEEWRMACEVRHVLSLPSLEERRGYLAKAENARGVKAVNPLREAVKREFERRKAA